MRPGAQQHIAGPTPRASLAVGGTCLVQLSAWWVEGWGRCSLLEPLWRSVLHVHRPATAMCFSCCRTALVPAVPGMVRLLGYAMALVTRDDG